MDLDTMTSLQIVTTMNDEDLRAVQSVTKVLPQVATAIDWAAEALERGGRVFINSPPLPLYQGKLAVLRRYMKI